MAINKAGLELIKEFEGLRLRAYQDSVGVWTIGYGTTAAADVGIVPRAGMSISQAQAETYLKRAIDKFDATISPLWQRKPTANQHGAMLSLAYNIGPGAFAKSTVLRKFNAGDDAGAGDAFLMWNRAGGEVLPGLVRRRDAERDLFLTPATNLPTIVPTAPNIFGALIKFLSNLTKWKPTK